MRWPWVSRETADARVTALQDALDSARASASAENTRAISAHIDLQERLAAETMEAIRLRAEVRSAETSGEARVTAMQAERDAWKHYAEQADAKFTALWAKYLEATSPRPAVVRETHQTPEQAVRAHEQLFVSKLAADLRGKGVPGPMAEAEAARIRRELTPHA